MSTSTIVLTDKRFLEHDPGRGHPESPARLDADAGRPGARARRGRGHRGAAVRDRRRDRGGSPAGYREALAALAGRRARSSTPTPSTSPGSWDAARLAAGAAVERGRGGDERPRAQRVRAGAPARPPRRARPARWGSACSTTRPSPPRRARRAGAARVLILDWDVHHGNGTQEIFAARDDVLYMSVHQYPFYPGTGAADEVGRRRGRGRDGQLPAAAAARATPTTAPCSTICSCRSARAFAPELVIVSAGFDAHARDPLADMRVTERGFAAMASAAGELADETCGGKLVLLLEGGYDLPRADGVGARVAGGDDRAPGGVSRRAAGTSRCTCSTTRATRCARRGARCRRADGRERADSPEAAHHDRNPSPGSPAAVKLRWPGPWPFGSGPAVATLFGRGLALVSLVAWLSLGAQVQVLIGQPRPAAGRRASSRRRAPSRACRCSICRRSSWWFHSDGALTAGRRRWASALSLRRAVRLSRAGSASRCRRCSTSRTSPSRATSCPSSGTTCCSSAASSPPSCRTDAPAPARALPVPAGAVQALLRIGDRQVAVAAARLAGRQRDDLLLRDRAAADLAGLVRAPPAGLVAPLREPRDAGARAGRPVRDLRPAPRRGCSPRRVHAVPDRQRRDRQLRLLLLPGRWRCTCSCSTTPTSSGRARPRSPASCRAAIRRAAARRVPRRPPRRLRSPSTPRAEPVAGPSRARPRAVRSSFAGRAPASLRRAGPRAGRSRLPLLALNERFALVNTLSPVRRRSPASASSPSSRRSPTAPSTGARRRRRWTAAPPPAQARRPRPRA